MMNRIDSRLTDELRTCSLKRDFLINADGSIWITQGKTRVICAVSIVPGVPRWMREQDVPGGWLTCEYQMLPASTHTRTSRDINRGKLNGRSQEIQRLIGRSLRSMIDLSKIGQNTVYVDCDVTDADGGTRCASITGASVALHLAFKKQLDDGKLKELPLRGHVAAISVGIVNGEVLLDLCYDEDSRADVDLNVVMMDTNKFVEVQGTAENETFSQEELDQMIAFAKKGIHELTLLQRNCVSS